MNFSSRHRNTFLFDLDLTDKKAVIKAIKMNGRPLSTRSDIEEHHLTIRIIDCPLRPMSQGLSCPLETCQFPFSAILNELIIEF